MELLDYCKTGNFEAVQELLVNGIDPNIHDDDDCTALYYASKHGHLNIVRELLEHNAPVNEPNWCDATPLHVCSTEEIARLLIQNGSGAETNMEAREAENNTPLHYASDNGFADVVQELINNGADINSKCDCEWTPLHWACQNGHPKVVQILIDHGASINEQDSSDATPLHYASSNGRLDVIYILGRYSDWM
jgi:ankyrin repeat protein